MTRKPVTAAEVETFLDILADLMSDSARHARLYVPLWKRLEAERDRLRDEEAVIAAASARFATLRAA